MPLLLSYAPLLLISFPASLWDLNLINPRGAPDEKKKTQQDIIIYGTKLTVIPHLHDPWLYCKIPIVSLGLICSKGSFARPILGGAYFSLLLLEGILCFKMGLACQ